MAAMNGTCRVQRRSFMAPPVSASMRLVFSDNFRGRGMKKRGQVLSEFYKSKQHEHHQGTATPAGRVADTFKRMPDVDDPRPPIIGWQRSVCDPDGSLKFLPVPNIATNGRKVLQGLYKDFKEVYNQHTKFIPLYGGGPWDPERGLPEDIYIGDSCSVMGSIHFNNFVFIGPSCVLRGDLNHIFINSMTILEEGVTVTTDGHPLNTNLPGRVSRINEGETHIGAYCHIGAASFMDSATLSGYNQVGENCKIGYNAIMEVGSSLESGSVLLAHQRVPRWEVWAGNPARRVGFRGKDMVKWRGFIDSVLSFRQRGLHDEQAFQAVNYVSASRSSENLQFYMDRKVEQNKDKLPEKVKSYITNETREIPMWEEFKNHSRVNIRPGLRKNFDWTYEPNKAQWQDKY